MHKHIERLRRGLAGRRAHVAAVLGALVAGYALWVYVPTGWQLNDFNALVLAIIVANLVLAARVLMRPERAWLIGLGCASLALLVPGPFITTSVQLVRPNPGILTWLWSYSVLVAGAGVTAYFGFKAAQTR